MQMTLVDPPAVSRLKQMTPRGATYGMCPHHDEPVTATINGERLCRKCAGARGWKLVHVGNSPLADRLITLTP